LNFQAGGIVYRVTNSETEITGSERQIVSTDMRSCKVASKVTQSDKTAIVNRFVPFGIDGKISAGVGRDKGTFPHRIG
jgi:hypothetical protein